MDAVLKFAKKHDFDRVVYITERGKYKVYQALHDGGMRYTGLPQYILADGDKIDWADYDETFEILDELNK